MTVQECFNIVIHWLAVVGATIAMFLISYMLLKDEEAIRKEKQK